MIQYTIEAAQNSKFLTKTIVSTDSSEIAEIAKNLGADVPFMRPAELAQDNSRHIPVIQHALNWLKDNKQETYDYVMILQPTSPLRMASDIDESIAKAVDTGADSVMGVVELVDFSVQKIKKIEYDQLVPLFQDEGRHSAFRQEAIKAYKRNGAIFLTKTDVIMRNDLFGAVSRPLVMPLERSVDINEPFDFELIEFLLSQKKHEDT
ncbi:MAG: hypothetical protein AUJ72_01260 [Candidatus Omnitrophica bacterium CG1_02_46_14]|nr:MAG: hypothetical protein AUJ72_01260 [Candidatus Omnitrophica bacterium CG1_02_46_14]